MTRAASHALNVSHFRRYPLQSARRRVDHLSIRPRRSLTPHRALPMYASLRRSRRPGPLAGRGERAAPTVTMHTMAPLLLLVLIAHVRADCTDCSAYGGVRDIPVPMVSWTGWTISLYAANCLYVPLGRLLSRAQRKVADSSAASLISAGSARHHSPAANRTISTRAPQKKHTDRASGTQTTRCTYVLEAQRAARAREMHWNRRLSQLPTMMIQHHKRRTCSESCSARSWRHLSLPFIPLFKRA